MKKMLLTALIVVSFALCADASMVIVDYQGETRVHQASVERNLLINSDDGGIYNVAFRPLDTGLRNLDGTVVIPLENLYINNNREDVYLRYNEYSNILQNIEMGGIARNLTAKIRDFGMVPAGTYGINFEIQATDIETHSIITTTFNLQFVIPVTQEISLYNEMPKIIVRASDAFDKNKKITNESSPLIYINSNCDWELLVNSEGFGEGAGNYYIRTVGASSNVTERLLEKVLLTQGKEFVIARGKAPANNEYVSVEYSLESKDGKILQAGNYNNRVKYILREGSR